LEVGYLSEKPMQTERLKLLRFAGICGILGSVLPLVMVLSATFLSSWFSWSENALSELGVGEQASIFNSAMLLGGVLNFLFALGLYRYLGSGKLVRAGVFSIMVSSVSLALVGVFTVDSILMHGVAAFGYFMLTPAGFLLIGFGTKEGVIRKLSYGCGVAALLAIIGLPVVFLALPFKVGFAIPELIEGLIISAWTIYMSTRLLKPL
jgi:hypothetical membrane protein